MHLTKRILPFLIVEALKGKTWADKAVFDSPGDVGTIRVDGDGGLFVAVYCDEWDLKNETVPDEAQETGPGSFRIVIEVGASRPITAASDDDGKVSELTATDQGLEWQIAFISRQCIDTLLASGPGFPWSDLFQRFIGGSLQRYSIRRGGPPNDAARPAPRYASCVSQLKVSVVAMEPPRGRKITAEGFPLWNDLFAMMGKRDDLAGLAKIIRAHFEPVDGIDLDDAVIDGARMWVSAETMAALGLAREADMRFVPEAQRRPTAEPVRPDVPLDADDMQRWLASQGPDPEQGPPIKGPPVDAG